MLKTAFKIFKEIIKWIVFVFVFFVFWMLLTILNPDMRFCLIPFVILFLIFHFPKTLLGLIIASFKSLKKALPDDESSVDNNLTTLEYEQLEETKEFSPLEEILFRTCIVISIVFLCLIIYKYFDNLRIANEIAKYNMKNTNIDVSMDPFQTLCSEEKSFTVTRKGKKFTITPLAKYKIAGVVVVKNTFLFDATQPISPLDLGIVWGDLAKPENYQRLKFFSNFRLMTHTTPRDFPLDQNYITTHSSHNHIIPANDTIKSILMGLKKNDKVVLEGYLVLVTGKSINPWKSSLKRDDHLFNSGGGCEIFYVEKVKSI